MKKIFALSMLCVACAAHAEYRINIPLQDSINMVNKPVTPVDPTDPDNGKLVDTDPFIYGMNILSISNCNWSPENHFPTVNNVSSETGRQNATCLVTKEFMVQEQKINDKTGVITASGSPYSQQSSDNDTSHRDYAVTTGLWILDAINESSCTTWTPDQSTMTNGVQFTQTGTGCSQDKQRTVSEHFVDALGLGSDISENQSTVDSNATMTRLITAVSNWVPSAQPAYSNYLISSMNNCTFPAITYPPLSSPDGNSGGAIGVACNKVVTYDSQQQEKNSVTNDTRPVGPITSSSFNQNGSGVTATFVVNAGPWVHNIDMNNCATWTPSTANVNAGTPMKQYSTDCMDNKTRTISETFTILDAGYPLASGVVTSYTINGNPQSHPQANGAGERDTVGTKPPTCLNYTTSFPATFWKTTAAREELWISSTSVTTFAALNSTSIVYNGKTYVKQSTTPRETSGANKFYQLCYF